MLVSAPMARFASTLLALTLGFTGACASDDSSDDDDGGDADTGNSSNSTTATSSNSTTQGNTSAAETTGSTECHSDHHCVNDVCTCDTPGKEMTPCDDEMACEMQCEVCG